MPSPEYREIEKGPTFEVYQGPLATMRLDWTRDEALRSTHVGHMGPSCAEAIIRRYEVMVRAKQPITALHDAWEATGYESAFRVELTSWAKKNPNAVVAVHMLIRSKLVNMGLAVVALALPGLMHPHSKRDEFNVLCKKLGMPLNPQMPQPRGLDLSTI